MSITFEGYLASPYLTAPYLTGLAFAGTSSQVNRVIAAAPAVHSQANRAINAAPGTSSQVNRTIATGSDQASSQVNRQVGAGPAVHSQTNRQIASAAAASSQANRQIASGLSGASSQANLMIAAAAALSSQAFLAIVTPAGLSSQVRRLLSTPGSGTGMSILVNTLLHTYTPVYLSHPYLSTPYLSPDFDARLRMQVTAFDTHEYPVGSQVSRTINAAPGTHSQVSRTINATKAVHSQVLRTINAARHVASQVSRTIKAARHLGSQVSRVFIIDVHSQATMVIYNVTNLRILQNFPSRGTGGGSNWTASSTEAGDFLAANLNTDIIEQVWRSDPVDGTAMLSLVCDTGIPQGVFIDTLAILNHNFTKSAVVILQGSNDPLFGTVGLEITLKVTLQNMYYIAPTLPNAGYQYYRFLLEDVTNPAGYLQVGTIVFGAAIIFVGDDIANPITFGRKHFKDTIQTEGYTSASNDRALRAYVKLAFRDMDFTRGNYPNLTQLFETARTSLKCLWIPTPQYPGRFAVFGKLVQIPEETHIDNGEDSDIINLDVEVDESL